mgnify:FL=1|jgi:hypothetical protein|tara:strand:- start:1730 stop:1918 length:189 start_codon:yes stop_codon:yes gene_type:complete
MNLFTQTIANQIPTGLDRYDQIFAAKRLILASDSPILATCRETLEEIEEIIFQRDAKELADA